MPQLGETVTEGTITRWFKQPGDAVAQDEPLFEVSTDKVDSEVPSPESGVLTEILVPEGETAEVGDRLAVIGDAGDAASPSDDVDRGRRGDTRGTETRASSAARAAAPDRSVVAPAGVLTRSHPSRSGRRTAPAGGSERGRRDVTGGATPHRRKRSRSRHDRGNRRGWTHHTTRRPHPHRPGTRFADAFSGDFSRRSPCRCRHGAVRAPGRRDRSVRQRPSSHGRAHGSIARHECARLHVGRGRFRPRRTCSKGSRR